MQCKEKEHEEHIIKGTTPSVTIDIEGVLLSEYDWIHIALNQANKQKVWKSEDNDLVIEGNSVTFFMSQEDTLFFRNGSTKIQFNAGSNDGGQRVASEVQPFNAFDENLEDEVIFNE